MALKKILLIEGVAAVCRVRDDGELIEAKGGLTPEQLAHLGRFAQWYRRLISGNTDLLSLFSQMQGWSPSQGWIVRGAAMTVCSRGNLFCLVENARGSVDEVMRALAETAGE